MFSHDLKDALLFIRFRKSIQSNATKELTSLVKAAVSGWYITIFSFVIYCNLFIFSGDESALDLLTTWRPRTALRNFSHTTSQDNYCFYTGTQSGTLYYINQVGTCTEIVRSESTPIIQLLWNPKQDSIICLMEDITIGYSLYF